jgi:ATP-binding cassette subfamily C (CFTR/MRP) protein 2
MSNGEVLQEGPYHLLLASSREFQDLVNAHKETASSERLTAVSSSHRHGTSSREIRKTYIEKQLKACKGDQLIKQEERAIGDTGFKPYRQYLNQNKGFLYFSMACISHLIFAIGLILQNSWMAVKVDNPHVSTLRLVLVYLLIGLASILFLICRCLCTLAMGLKSSESSFSQLLDSLFHAPMSFYDSTPLGRILSRVSMANMK